jgi:hypothetical protein
VEEKEKWWGDSDVGTRRQKTGIGWKERKEGAECVMRRETQSSPCGMDVAKWKGGREETGRNTEWRRKGNRMDVRDMKEEGKDGEGYEWGIEIIRWNCYFMRKCIQSSFKL